MTGEAVAQEVLQDQERLAVEVVLFKMIRETEDLDHEERADGPITHRRPTGRRLNHSSKVVRNKKRTEGI